MKFNLPQLLLATASQPEKYLEGGRGLGKSTSVAWEIKDVVTEMPRSNNIIVGETYQQILSRTLPSTLAGLERLKIYRDVHYFIGHPAPRKLKWEKPVMSPEDWKSCIHFWTGAAYNLVSQQMKDSGRGLNSDSVIGDEMNLLHYDKLAVDVLATCRGSDPRFSNSRKFRNKLFVGTTPLLQHGKWVYAKEQKARLKPDEILYIRAHSFMNKDILGDAWFRDMKRDLPDYLYSAEILNIRPTQIADGFYPMLKEDHYYSLIDANLFATQLQKSDVSIKYIDSRGDADCNTDLPLEIAIDWGANINCMCVTQPDGDVMRFINEFFVKSPKILDHLFTDKFIPYYKHHKRKKVIIYYDRNGNSRLANSELTYINQASLLLSAAGWQVELKSRGLDPHHQDKFMLWNNCLKETDYALPKIRFNKDKCKYTIVSMQNAPADERKGIHKDKSSERKEDYPQEEATHFSDAADIIVYGKYGHLLKGASLFIPNMFGKA